MSAAFNQPLPTYNSVGQVGHSLLAQKIGARGYDGGTYNSPFSASGGVKEPFMAPGAFNASMFMRPRRRRLNILSIVVSMLLPISVFAITAWLFCFAVRDSDTLSGLGWWFMLLCVVLAIGFIIKARIVKKSNKEEEETVPWYLRSDDETWLMFLGVAVILAVLLGLLYGEYIYNTFTKPYYMYSQLHTYKDVDPAQPGKAYLDVGAIEFHNESYADVSQSLGYKDRHVYCVAPIKKGREKVANFDFWAVGIDCCNGFPGSFNCFPSGRNSAKTHGGLRVLDDSAIEFYKVAVMQATEEYRMHGSVTPIFFTWVKDPVQEVRDFWHDGLVWYIAGVAVFALLVIAAVLFMAQRYWQKRLWG